MTTLEDAAVRALLNATVLDDVEKLEVFSRIDSTNSYLRDQLAPERGKFRVALADHQTAGRGRHANPWVSAPGLGLCLSLAHTFRRKPANLSALTLALGVGAVDVLAGFGISGIGLKWPNDLLAADAKLGGILVESQVGRRDETVVVAGIGLNITLPSALDEEPQPDRMLPAIGLDSLVAGPPSREALAAAMIVGWRRTMKEYETGGFERFMHRYGMLDWLGGKTVVVRTAGEQLAGMAAGVSSSGALLVKTPNGTVPVISGTIMSVETA